MNTTTSSVSTTMVNAAFLQEVKDSNLQFWQNVHDFKRLLNHSAEVHDQSARLVRLLSELRDSIALEFSLEETYGYIDGNCSGNSLSGRKAGQAKRQHRELYLQLHEISESAEEAQYRGTIVQDFPALVVVCKEFLAALEEHEKHESELIRFELGIGRFGS
jgi:hypothetical protein